MDLLVHAGIRVLEALFFLGVVGSNIVLARTLLEDVPTLTGSDVPTDEQA